MKYSTQYIPTTNFGLSYLLIHTNRWCCSVDSVEYLQCLFYDYVYITATHTRFELTHTSCLTQLPVAVGIPFIYGFIQCSYAFFAIYCSLLVQYLLECVSVFIIYYYLYFFCYGVLRFVYITTYLSLLFVDLFVCSATNGDRFVSFTHLSRSISIFFFISTAFFSLQMDFFLTFPQRNSVFFHFCQIEIFNL